MNSLTAGALPDTGAIPIVGATASSGRREMFGSLRVRNYRIFTSSNVLAMISAWVQRIAQDWLILEMTGSVAAVGVMTAVQCAPILLFGLHGGVLVDRYPTRRLLVITQSATFVLSATLATLSIAGVVTVWEVFVIAFLLGVTTALDNPARQVFPSELVGPRQMTNAISLNSSIFQLGGIIGPALSAFLLVAVGAGWSFATNALAAVLVVITLLAIRTKELHPRPRSPRGAGQLKDGLGYAIASRRIRSTLLLAATLSVLAFPLPVVLAAYATDVFGTGAGGYGLFNSVVAVGAVAGALVSTRRVTSQLRRVVLWVAVLGMLYVTASALPFVVAFCVVLALIGFVTLLFITEANALLQDAADPRMRGRVMSMWALLVIGGQAAGGPLLGWAAERFGAPIGLGGAGILCVVIAGTVGAVLARSRPSRELRRHPLDGLFEHGRVAREVDARVAAPGGTESGAGI